MSPVLMLLCIAVYFAALLGIAWKTGRSANSEGYFLGNRRSPWYAVAFGLLGDSLSGVTFISVPGQVGTSKFSYLQIVLGYVLGYVVIAELLLPLYYRLRLTSIYSYLGNRFGGTAQVTGSFFFLISRLAGAGARLYLAASVLQLFIFDRWHIPFSVSVAGSIALMLIYTYRGGIKTLVWTDVFQSTFLLVGVVLSILAIARALDLGPGGLFQTIRQSDLSQVFVWDWQSKNFFWKQILSGAFIAIVMTGLDQNSMQKNLSCRSLPEAKKNIYSFAAVMVAVNILFLSLGVLLYEYARAKGITIPGKADALFPTLALEHLGPFAAIVFLVGLTAATFSSADSVLTTLTTSFCIDFARIDSRTDLTDVSKTRLRHVTHLCFAVLLLAVILAFRYLNNDSVITAVLTLATYTYGPLLGLFAFGLFTRQKVRSSLVPVICTASPLACFWINGRTADWFGGYQLGFELLILNGLLTCLGLLLIRQPATKPQTSATHA